MQSLFDQKYGPGVNGSGAVLIVICKTRRRVLHPADSVCAERDCAFTAVFL